MAQKDKQQSTADWERELENLGRTLGKEMRGLGRELRKSLDLGPDARDFSNSLRDVAREFSRAAGEVGRSARKAAEPYQKERRRKKFFKKLRSNYTNLKGCALGFGLSAFVIAMAAMIVMLDGDPEWIIMLAPAAAFAVPAIVCKVKSYQALRLMSYHQALEGHSYCTIEELSAAVDRPVYKTLQEVRTMMRQGSFEGMYLAPDGSRLFTNRTAYLAYTDAMDAQAAARAREQQEAAARAQASGPEKAARTVSDELQAFLAGLQAEKAPITDGEVAAQVQRLEDATRALLTWLEGHPASEKKVRRFAAYYLPTTLKLLHTYNEVDAQADQSAVAADIQRNIVGILHTINQAFSTLQDGLLQDTALDVSAEISALETVLTQEGLAGEDGLLLK